MQKPLKPRILVTNDDGIQSKNLHALAMRLSSVGDVFVFAPATEQSGVSHAFSARPGIKVELFETGDSLNYTAFQVWGTPADCVKFAIGHFTIYGIDNFQGVGPFDVCFSGINLGENSGVSAIYSGTVAGAREAALWGVPGIALSLRGGESMYSKSLDFALKIVEERLFEKVSKNTYWNVNFPKCSIEDFKGFKGAKMATGMFTDYYTKKDRLWLLDGEKKWSEQPIDSDDFLLEEGYATITPLSINQTDETSLKLLNEFKI